MKIKKESMIYGAVGLLVGLLIASVTAMLATNNKNATVTIGAPTSNMSGEMKNEDMNMSQMTASLQNKTGDDFDKNFLSMMVAHHVGAIDMAKLAQVNAKHNEIRKLANDIISAQSKEIHAMQTWQTDWSYGNTSQSHMMEN